ncbi:MAG: AraC family transcriptional regulator [Crocosphaera sp.]|nr:AraC family transcriptional regulator [Crocosphaera sp.]
MAVFDDFEAYMEFVKSFNIQCSLKLTPGTFQGRINSLHLREMNIISTVQNQTLYVQGPKFKNCLHFCMVFSPKRSPMLSHGTRLKKWDLFGFDTCRDANLIMGQGTQVITIAINRQFFDTVAETMGYQPFNDEILKPNIARFRPHQIAELRNYYQQINQILLQQRTSLRETKQNLIVENFLPLLINTFGQIIRERNTKNTQVKSYGRYAIVKKAEEFTLSHLHEPITLQQLCETLGTSSTALSAGFKEIFRVSPMNYLKIQRLHGVHRTLKNADPSSTRVMSVAHEWGFWSLNHFSRDYQKLFGELPSQTLRK